ACEGGGEPPPGRLTVPGDLPSRPRGEPQLRALLARLPHPYVVLGNHDYAVSRDPFSRPVELRRLEDGHLLLDESEVVELRGKRIELAGVDPRTWLRKRRSGFADAGADLRILLCHFPRALESAPAGRW